MGLLSELLQLPRKGRLADYHDSLDQNAKGSGGGAPRSADHVSLLTV